MAAHVKRIICKAMRQIVESTTAKPSERLRAARLLFKVRYLGPQGKPRGRHVAKKSYIGVKKTHSGTIDDILDEVSKLNGPALCPKTHQNERL